MDVLKYVLVWSLRVFIVEATAETPYCIFVLAHERGFDTLFLLHT